MATLSAKNIFMKIISVVIVGVFALAAAYISYTLVRDIQAVEKSRNWVAVPAKVISYALAVSSPAVSVSAAASNPKSEYIKAEYSYGFDGKTYTGTQIDFADRHADNFAQERRARQMKTLSQGDITVYVDPQNPQEAVVDRSLPAEKALFMAFFLLFPCGLGTIFVVFTLLQPIKPLYKYAPQIWFTLHSLPALWLLLRYSGEYGWRGIILLTLISALLPVAIYTGARKFGKP